MNRFLTRVLCGLAASTLAISAFGEEVTPTAQRGSYALNGRIHVGLFGHPDGKATPK